MEKTILQIINACRVNTPQDASSQDNAEGPARRLPAANGATNPATTQQPPTKEWLERTLRARNREMHDATRHVSKRRLLAYYMEVRREGGAHWQSWQVDTPTHEAVVTLLQAKPRRTASGVATITVLTRPRACSSDCIYCPSDARMPKSYMNNEPACQRAERNYFDPYLQVASRMRVLNDMGHLTDKVELIVLGGTWSDYPESYQVWFMSQMYAALNDGGAHYDTRRTALEAAGCIADADRLAVLVAPEQAAIDTGHATYNQTREALDRKFPGIYSSPRIDWGNDNLAKNNAEGTQSAPQPKSNTQPANTQFNHIPETLEQAWAQLEALQAQNEHASHRNVGLVVETRPDLITPESLRVLRALGCTKVQMGIQSLDTNVLTQNKRHVSIHQIARAFELLRLYGFKSHIHFMVNLLGATPEADKADFTRLVSDERFLPDEAKLYPCALVENSQLMDCYKAGQWAPYEESALIDVLATDVLKTPAYTRISRMIRDISATDIVVGNKKTNLRQLVEQEVERRVAYSKDASLDRNNANASINANTAANEKNTSTPQDLRVHEMRMREIATGDVDVNELTLECIEYKTTVTNEYFLQWVGPLGQLAGFLRLSLPNQNAITNEATNKAFPIKAGQAMIREVHVYGRVAALHRAGDSAQHAGLGRQLVERAKEIAKTAGYKQINVISAIGTKDYYRNLGFKDNELYLTASM